MNYAVLYARFIANRQGRVFSPGEYSERHHIVPRCEGGGNEPENLIRLSARDHIFAHLVLAKWKGGVHWAALAFVSEAAKRRGTPTRQEIRIAAQARGLYQSSPEHRAFISGLHKGKIESLETRAKKAAANRLRTYRPHTQETKDRISKAIQGRSHTIETRAKISLFHKGTKQTPEHIAKVSAWHRGRKRSEETKAKLREAWTRRKGLAQGSTT